MCDHCKCDEYKEKINKFYCLLDELIENKNNNKTNLTESGYYIESGINMSLNIIKKEFKRIFGG